MSESKDPKTEPCVCCDGTGRVEAAPVPRPSTETIMVEVERRMAHFEQAAELFYESLISSDTEEGMLPPRYRAWLEVERKRRGST